MKAARWIIVVLVVLALIGAGLVWLSSGPQVGQWEDSEAEQRYARAYEDLLADLPEEPEQGEVETSHGTVHYLRWDGDGEGEPVLLFPGISSGAAQWVENLPAWIGERDIIAVDPLGDAGFSVQTVAFEDTADQAGVYAELLDELGIERAHVVGHSFGGAVAATFASLNPDRVASLELLEPVVVADSMPLSTYFWATVSSLPLPQSWRDRALAEIGGTSPEDVRGDGGPMVELIDAASTGYAAALPLPKELTDEQWQAITAPVRLDLGGQQSLSGADAADRIRGLLPGAQVTVWENGTHSLPMDEAEEFGRLLPTFWAQSETELAGGERR